MSLLPVPLYWRRRAQIALHNLRTRDPQRRVRVSREGELVRLSVGDDSIAISSIGRWKRYRGGIPERLDAIAGRYGALAIAGSLRRGTVIDVGANIGEFSLWLARQGCDVCAIEPDPTNFSALQANTMGLPIRSHKLALWDKDEEIRFYSAVARADSSLIEPETYHRELRVQAVTLDGLTRREGIGAVDFIKADVEGAEPEMLRGASETLGRTRRIAIDCGPERHGERTFRDCQGILEGLGFRVRALDAEGNMLFGEHPDRI